MAEVQLIKAPGGLLRPANDSDAAALERLRNGALLRGELRQVRNPQFHRKFFALLNFAFDYWTPPEGEYKGIKAEKNFDRFRKDVVIYAGFYDVVTNLKGETRVEAKSISFGSMDEAEFGKVYSAVFNVCWQLVLSGVQGLTREQAENIVNEMLSYD